MAGNKTMEARWKNPSDNLDGIKEDFIKFFELDETLVGFNQAIRVKDQVPADKKNDIIVAMSDLNSLLDKLSDQLEGHVFSGMDNKPNIIQEAGNLVFLKKLGEKYEQAIHGIPALEDKTMNSNPVGAAINNIILQSNNIKTRLSQSNNPDITQLRQDTLDLIATKSRIQGFIQAIRIENK